MADPFASFGTRKAAVTPTTVHAPIAGRTDMVRNNTTGFVFQQDTLTRLESFLILGTEGGSYYSSEQELTKQNVQFVIAVIAEYGKTVVDTVVDISVNGRAYKQNPTLFTLALCASVGIGGPAKYEEEAKKIRAYALSKVNDVCRTGTMFFQFLEYCKQFRGNGRAMQEAMNAWYLDRTPDSLANQLVKYRQRNGWSHSDVLRLSRPALGTKTDENVVTWKGKTHHRGVYNQEHPNAQLIRWTTGKGEAPTEGLVAGYLAAQKATTAKEWVKLIADYKLPWEALPTQALNEKAVWEALVPHMGMTAIFRNLGKMSSCGALVNHSDLAKVVNARITDAENITRSRVHPMQVLLASQVYAMGRGVKGSNTWTPVPTVKDNLTEAFYASFGNLPVTNKRRLFALDVSGSMEGAHIMNTFMTARDATAALVMVGLHQDPESYCYGFSMNFTDLGLTAKMRLDEVIRKISRLPFDRTNVSLPFTWALQNKIELDSIEVYTDNEVNVGTHPAQAMTAYRKQINPTARLVVNGMVANGFTVADPLDPLSMDVVGFDANVPKIVSEFITC